MSTLATPATSDSYDASLSNYSNNSSMTGPQPIDPNSAIFKIQIVQPKSTAKTPSWTKGSNAKFNFTVHAYVTPELEKAADEELERMKHDHNHGHKHDKHNHKHDQQKDQKEKRAEELKRRAKMMEEMIMQMKKGSISGTSSGGNSKKKSSQTDDKQTKKEAVTKPEGCTNHDHDHNNNGDHDHSTHHKEVTKLSSSNESSSSGAPFKRIKVGDSIENDPTNPFEMRIGLGFSVPAMEKCVKTMKVGERARFLCMPDECEVGSKRYLYLQCAVQICFSYHAWHNIHHYKLYNQIQGYSQLETVLRQEKKNRELIAEGKAPMRAFGCCAHSASQEQTYNNRDLLLCVGAPLEFEIELLSIQEPNTFSKEIWEMNAIEKYKEAPKRKDEGTELYKKGDYAGACEKYTRALMLLESLSISPAVTDLQRERTREAEAQEKEERRKAEERKRLERLGRPIPPDLLERKPSPSTSATNLSSSKSSSSSFTTTNNTFQPPNLATSPSEIDPEIVLSLMQTTRLNYAACKLKLQDYPAVITQCTEVLNKDKGNGADSSSSNGGRNVIKALFRRAQAYMKIGRDLDLAEKDLSRMKQVLTELGVAETAGEWVELKREEKELERLMSIVKNKEKAMFSKMFA
jgi:tetratricopeptide (TPR) repeat protein